MYGLPINIDLGFFERKTLYQVCFGAHDLMLNFAGGIRVAVTSSIGLCRSDGSIQQCDNFAQAAPTLIALLNKDIVSANGDPAGTLRLEFDGGVILLIYDDSKQYESYTIENGEQLIVV